MNQESRTTVIYSNSEFLQKLQELYSFLSSYRQYNKAVQERFYKTAILSFQSTEDRITALLYDIANTQSQPRIDKLAEFFKYVHDAPSCLKSFRAFVDRLAPGQDATYKNLYSGLRSQNGWGKKTSALFTKTIYHLHNGEYNRDLIIWDDAPRIIAENDEMFLPVDAVIIAIFKVIDPGKKWNYDNISKVIETYYSREEVEVWDDLWFWGFITQNGSGTNRTFGWNENKYWMLKESDKDSGTISEIKAKAEQFLGIILSD